MDVIDSPLNTAHQKGRLADNCEKSGKLDKAIQYHKQTCDFLNEALNAKLPAVAYKSIELQKKYHEKCIRRLEVKKKEIEVIIKAKQNDISEKSIAQMHIKCTIYDTDDHFDKYEQLFPELYLSTDFDSLLQCTRYHANDIEKPPVPYSSTSYDKSQNGNTSITIEELKTKNNALVVNIEDLLLKMTVKDLKISNLEHENALLKEKLQLQQVPVIEHKQLEMMKAQSGLDIDLPPLETPEFVDFSDS